MTRNSGPEDGHDSHETPKLEIAKSHTSKHLILSCRELLRMNGSSFTKIGAKLGFSSRSTTKNTIDRAKKLLTFEDIKDPGKLRKIAIRYERNMLRNSKKMTEFLLFNCEIFTTPSTKMLLLVYQLDEA